MDIFKILFVILTLISYPIVGWANPATKPVGKTEIQYTKNQTDAEAGRHPFHCKGQFAQPNLLKEIGYEDKDLLKGAPCQMVDFDGNKSLDYWFFKCSPDLHCDSKVILMDHANILKSVNVQPKIPMEILLVKENAGHAGLKDLGCRFPPNGALLQPGEGDGNDNIIYTLNKDKTAFTEFSRCTNVESVD
jgi:hypothetical protein